MTLEINIASNRLKNDPIARDLIDHLKSIEASARIEQGVVYYDFPLFRDTDDVLYRSQVMLVSKSHGLALFAASDLTDRTFSEDELSRIDDSLSQLHSIIYGRLLKSRLLRASREKLLFGPLTVVVIPSVSGLKPSKAGKTESEVVSSFSQVDSLLAGARLYEPLSDEAWAELRSIVEGAKGLVRPKEREVPPNQANGKAAILKQLESEIVNFDIEQRRAAISIVDGPQRIRGLAGSGKTVVLAMKAAHIHLSQPDAHILFTFHTKSLYDFIKRLITRFYRQFNDRDPDFENRVHVLHSWGGKSLPGVYSTACYDAGVQPLNYKDAAEKSHAPFEYVCADLVKTGRVKQKYDYVLLDEAQDLPVPFFRLCFQLANGGAYDRNIVWAYDELQNIINVRTITPKQAFGVDRKSVPLIDLDRAADSHGVPGSHDIVLHRCYRNAREILVSAHALGFGIYSDTMVQMLENKEHWEDVGYVVDEGDCIPGEKTVITRPRKNSPLSISDHQKPNDLISSFVATSIEEEIDWVVKGVQELIQEGLRPDDILIVTLDDRNARYYLTNIAMKLSTTDVETNNVLGGGAYSTPRFVVEREVTLSTVYSAKGNEAPVVFVIGIEALYPERKFKRARNKLFTAMTRARGWLRISGVGAGAQFYVDEIERALSNSPHLRFVYPDVATVERLQRDLSDKASRLRKVQGEIERALEQLDLDDEERAALAESLMKRKK